LLGLTKYYQILLKNGGLTLKLKLHKLIVKIWKQEKYLMNGLKIFCVQFTKKGTKHNVIITEGYPY
jgi:hypothetical protein